MSDNIFDIAIIGAGPAGLSAALTARVRNKSVALFEHLDFSPKLQKAHAINNYIGLPATPGKDVIKQFADHCLAAGPTLIKEKVTNIFTGEPFTLLTPHNTYEAKAVVISIGVVSSALIAGEKDLVGKGVCYCATCDGMLYRDKPVAVIAYTPEGEHEANFLGEICPVVYFLPQYKTDFQPSQPTVKVMSAKVQSIVGSEEVTGLVTDAGELAGVPAQLADVALELVDLLDDLQRYDDGVVLEVTDGVGVVKQDVRIENIIFSIIFY